MNILRFGVVCALISVVSSASADDWNAFRGPQGDGIVRQGKPPTKWSDKTNVAWEKAIPGHGWSSPVVVGGRVYLTSAVPMKEGETEDLSLDAFCLDAKDGRILWQQPVFRQEASKAPRIHAKNSHASPTPLIEGGRVYVHFGHQGTACLDLDGAVIWKTTELKYQPVHGNGGSPILTDGLLIFSCDGASDPYVAALDAKSGKLRWKTPREAEVLQKFSFSTPLLITVLGRKQIVSAGSGAVLGLDLDSGKEIWRVRYKGGYSVIPKPVASGGLVYVTTGYGSPNLLAIRPDGMGDVTDSHVAWRATKAVPHTPSLIVNGDELYMVSDGGVASCLDAKTGRVYWSERVGGNYSASPILADGKIYFQSEQGGTTVVEAGRAFEVLAKNTLPERTLASYAVAGNSIYLRTEKRLYRIEEK